MKLNWGTGIVLGFLSFMSFILFFVLKLQTNSAYDNELVVKDYYKQEKNVQDNIDKQNNANHLVEKLSIQKTEEGIEIVFPKHFDATMINGTISLYRPSNQKLDFETKISLSGPIMLIPKNKLVGGLWEIAVDWDYEAKKYLNKETIYF
ncbi:FixH family protein [Flavobacterium sp. 20NA77.7]|uniref:FixH family protein n=1 Tax=Flavobacterium nakdongensis TaxID=3073563 RepID=A0ABY9R6P6_9FLAO|nr:FixH family protein [Flavobacterium sp. 20NA77.7]WMW76940.1 FixH family protein [Flavobacterium sp. 20NA77.7]